MSGTDSLILIIDDELPIRRLLRAVLTSQGYGLAEAVAGREGLAQAATLRPDLIILELELPDINGLHVIAQLREWANTPIVVLSASSQEGVKVAALDGGADDYLTKPCGVGELLARMRVALRRAAGRPEGERTDHHHRRVASRPGAPPGVPRRRRCPLDSD